jgi:hypothetical protein
VVTSVRVLAATIAVLAAVALADERYDVGSTIPRLALEDQHGAAGAIDDTVRIVVLTRDMDAGNVVKETLADEEQRFLDEHHAVYVADISRMPALVSRLIAVPRMRGRRYRVFLDRKGDLVSRFPVTDGKPSVVYLERGRVTRVVHPATANELRAVLTATAP